MKLASMDRRLVMLSLYQMDRMIDAGLVKGPKILTAKARRLGRQIALMRDFTDKQVVDVITYICTPEGTADLFAWKDHRTEWN